MLILLSIKNTLKFMTVEENVDLLKVSNVEAIGHCANCFCTMGSGIANQIKKVFPEAYTADLKTVSGDINKFGTFSVGVVNSNNTSIKYVYNLYGQYRYGRDSRKLNYEKIYTALESMEKSCKNNNVTFVGFPKNMGCMLAGGHWPIVYKMIEHIFSDPIYTVKICNYA